MLKLQKNDNLKLWVLEKNNEKRKRNEYVSTTGT